MLKILIKIIKLISALLVALVLILILANLGDEELKPEVKQALNWQPPEHAFDKDNGYLVLLGMDAPAEQDAWQVGKQRLQTENAKTFKQIQKENQEQLAKITKNPKTSAKSSAYSCDYFKQQNCIDYYLSQDKAKMNADFAQFSLQLKRFEAIKQSKYFIEAASPLVMPYSLAGPEWSQLMNASHINRIKAALLIDSGDLGQGVSLFVNNTLFSRRFSKESSNLISRMLAIKLLQVDMRILSELIVKYPKIATYRQQLLPVVQPISGVEYNMKKVFSFERDSVINFVQNNKNFNYDESFYSPSLSEKIANTLFFNALFYKPNSTTNLFYDIGTLRLKLTESSAKDLLTTYDSYQAKLKGLFGFGFEPFYLRNPAGKFYTSLGDYYYLNYFERQYDTDGYIRLVGLQLALAAEKPVSDERIQQIMQDYPDPYTDKPMDFDAKTRQISFHGRQKSRVNVDGNSVYTIKVN